MSTDQMQGVWTLIRYRWEGRLVEPAEGSASLTIDGDRLAGSMGINRVMGAIDSDGVAGPLASTMMAGPPELMDQEHRLLKLLEDSDSIVVGKDGMTWLREGLSILEFQRSGTNGEVRSSD